MAGLKLDQVYRCENLSDHPLDLGWGRERWIIQPGQERAVLAGALVNAFGDWRSKKEPYLGRILPRDPNSQVIQIPSRQEEIDRLAGYYFKGGENPGNEPEKVLSRMPKVKITDLQGEVITQVLEDPQNFGGIAPDTIGTDREFLESQLREHLGYIKAIEARLEEPSAMPQDPGSVQEDGPPPVLATALRSKQRS